MLKKILLGVLFVGLIGVLIAGAINRTASKDEQSHEIASRSDGKNRVETVNDPEGSQPQGQTGSTSGLNTPAGQSVSTKAAQQANSGPMVVHEWLELQGLVESVDEVALTVSVPGEANVIIDCQAWIFALDEGFSAQVGDRVSLSGFYLEEIFKVGQMDDLTNGQSVVLRDQDGRALWSGQGKNSN